MVTIQNYVRAQSLEEAWQLNQKRRNRILGGMLWIKMSRNSINTAIDLCDLGLDTITETDEEFSIDAMVTLRRLEQHAGLNIYSNGAVEKAVKDIVGVQFRNTATIGGSIWGRFGFSDVLSVFLAMDSYVELYKGGIIPLKDFVAMPYDRDVLIRLIVKKVPGKFVYAAMRNQRTDFPVITCACAYLDGEFRTVIGARPSRAMLISDSQRILKDGITPSSAAAFAEYVSTSVPTFSNIRGSAAYRTRLIRVLTERNLIELGGLE